MKKFALAAAMAVASTAAFAGNPLPPAPDPVVIVEDTGSSAQGIIVPILAIVLIAAAAVAAD